MERKVSGVFDLKATVCSQPEAPNNSQNDTIKEPVDDDDDDVTSIKREVPRLILKKKK